MSEQLFGTIANPPQGPGNKRYTVPGTLIGMVVAALLFGVQSMMAVDPPEVPNKGMSRPYVDIFLPQPPPIPRRAQTQKVETPTEKPSFPTESNKGINPEPDKPQVDPEPVDDDGHVDGDGDKVVKVGPPPAVEPEKPQEPIRPTSYGIKVPQKIYDVRPVYPQIAQAARVQGIVIIEAIIGTNGAVTGAKVLRSVPLLDQAALDAVRQWRYPVTTMGGVPIALVVTVTVQFTLQ